jgi:hypothetical protein|nr:MAG TPA: hypothetical protein [Caudoviricetes sp.]
MRKFRITYKECKQEGKAIVGHIATLDVYDIEIDEGFVAIWIDDSHKGSAPDMAINASLVYKIERIEEEKK